MTTSLSSSTVDFLLGFARLCYHLVKSGNIKMTAIQSHGPHLDNGLLTFPDFGGVSIDQDRAETFGLMTIDQAGARLECEFRHLSLAEYLTALHVHVTGDTLKGFPRDRKELILQYLSGLASLSDTKDQVVVKEFLGGLNSGAEQNNAVDYLKHIQKMKGEWYNQQGELLPYFPALLDYVHQTNASLTFLRRLIIVPGALKGACTFQLRL